MRKDSSSGEVPSWVDEVGVLDFCRYEELNLWSRRRVGGVYCRDDDAVSFLDSELGSRVFGVGDRLLGASFCPCTRA